jgi:hypothetical protein
LSGRKHPNVIDVFLVLAVVRIEVEGSGVSHVTTGFIGHNGDIVTYLVLIRIALGGVKRITHLNIGRPGDAGISAIGIEQL